MDRDNTKGREENSAEPLGARGGELDVKSSEKLGRKEEKTAGPDGPDARAVGDTFKTQR